MKILKTVKKVPGGLMVIPLLIGAAINTLAPQLLEIGGFTTALFRDSATALIALFVLCNAAQIDIQQVGKPLYQGLMYILVKFVIGASVGWFVGKFYGEVGVLGLTPLALVGGLTSSNGGLYAALANQYGDSGDVGAVSILSMNSGPFFTMLAFGLTGIANIPFTTFISVLVPVIIGFTLGNLDYELRILLGKGTTFLIPFFAFPLGAALDFRTIIEAGVPGIILGIIVTLFTGLGGYFSTGLFGDRKAVGAAIGTTAGNAVGTPALIALTDPSLQPIVGIVTAQIAASVIVTAVFCPLLVSFLDTNRKKVN